MTDALGRAQRPRLHQDRATTPDRATTLGQATTQDQATTPDQATTLGHVEISRIT